MSFAIANKAEHSKDFDDWKMDANQDVLVAAKNEKGEVFLLQDEVFRLVLCLLWYLQS